MGCRFLCRLLQFRRKQHVGLDLDFQHIGRKMVSLSAWLGVARIITDPSRSIVVYIGFATPFAGFGEQIPKISLGQVLWDEGACRIGVGNPGLRDAIVVSSKSQIGIERLLWSRFFLFFRDQ